MSETPNVLKVCDVTVQFGGVVAVNNLNLEINKNEIIGLIGDVCVKTALIVDDFTISCGTLAEIARTLQRNGAKRILAFVSHALLSPKGIDVLMRSPIERLVTTDTVNNPWLGTCDKVYVLSVSEMFARAIRIIHEKESLAELFE